MRSGVVATVFGMSVAACSLALDFDSRPATDGGASASSSSGGSGGSSGASSSGSTSGSNGGDADVPTDGATNDAPSSGCPGTGGPMPVKSGSSCIDSTEVTKGQYAMFLASNPPTAGQPAACASNSTFVPAASWPPASGQEASPVVEIDWCDALAFCTWAKKKLCTEAQWSLACTAGVANMSGGVAEWIDNCTSDNCPVRGGTGCNASVDEPRISPHEDVGFRCCTP